MYIMDSLLLLLDPPDYSGPEIPKSNTKSVNIIIGILRQKLILCSKIKHYFKSSKNINKHCTGITFLRHFTFTDSSEVKMINTFTGTAGVL